MEGLVPCQEPGRQLSPMERIARGGRRSGGDLVPAGLVGAPGYSRPDELAGRQGDVPCKINRLFRPHAECGARESILQSPERTVSPGSFSLQPRRGALARSEERRVGKECRS